MTCQTGKIRYPNKVKATLAQKALAGLNLNVYRCRLCAGWHLGSKASAADFKFQRRIDQLLGKK